MHPQVRPAPASPVQGGATAFPLAQDSVRFAAIGDMGTGEGPQYELASRMAAERQRFPFTFTIMLGDNIYGSKSRHAMERKFDLPYKPLLDGGVQFFASLGNHDDPNERFYKLFNMNGQRYYTFKKGNVRFFALDSTYMDPRQLAWLEGELAKAGSDWKICFFHHPLYSSAAYHGSSLELRGLLEPLLVKYGVQAVFTGHDHVYERMKPQKGIYHFLEGASGELRAGNLREADFKAAGYDRDRTFMLVEIAADTLYFQTVTRTGAVVDSGRVERPRPGSN